MARHGALIRQGRRRAELGAASPPRLSRRHRISCQIYSNIQLRSRGDAQLKLVLASPEFAATSLRCVTQLSRDYSSTMVGGTPEGWTRDLVIPAPGVSVRRSPDWAKVAAAPKIKEWGCGPCAMFTLPFSSGERSGAVTPRQQEFTRGGRLPTGGEDAGLVKLSWLVGGGPVCSGGACHMQGRQGTQVRQAGSRLWLRCLDFLRGAANSLAGRIWEYHGLASQLYPRTATSPGCRIIVVFLPPCGTLKLSHSRPHTWAS